MLSREQVQYIAALSRINLQEEEIVLLQKTLTDILTYIEKLKKLDVANVKPTSHVLPLENVFRDDAVKPSLAQSEVMNLSVSHSRGAFKVPQVIE